MDGTAARESRRTLKQLADSPDFRRAVRAIVKEALDQRPGAHAALSLEAVRAVVKEEIRRLGKRSAADAAGVEQELIKMFPSFSYVRSVRCGPDGDGRILQVYHDHRSSADVIDELVGEIARVERRFRFYLEPWILHVSEESPAMPDGTRTIFERRRN